MVVPIDRVAAIICWPIALPVSHAIESRPQTWSRITSAVTPMASEIANRTTR